MPNFRSTGRGLAAGCRQVSSPESRQVGGQGIARAYSPVSDFHPPLLITYRPSSRDPTSLIQRIQLVLPPPLLSHRSPLVFTVNPESPSLPKIGRLISHFWLHHDLFRQTTTLGSAHRPVDKKLYESDLRRSSRPRREGEVCRR